MTSTWILESDLENHNLIKVHLIARVDPAGLIPAAFINYQAERDPFVAFNKLRLLVKDSRFANVDKSLTSIAFIKKIYGDKSRVKKIIQNRVKLPVESVLE